MNTDLEGAEQFTVTSGPRTPETSLLGLLVSTVTLPGGWTSQAEGTPRHRPWLLASTELREVHCTAGSAEFSTSFEPPCISTNP